MESVTDCWLCRLVIDLSGELCFSQAATVLWKPQEWAWWGGMGWMEALRIWEIWPQKKLIKVSVWRWREKDPQRQSRAQPPDSQSARASTDYCFRINLCAALSLGQRPGCRNPMSQQVAERHAPTYGFQMSGHWRRGWVQTWKCLLR